MAENTGESDDSQMRAAPGAARCATGIDGGQNTPNDADLRRLIEAWAELPEALRRGIMAMVEGVGGL
jgi:hypothetical protein